ncbi:hypothetical protein BJ742DRAFT_762919 [Cladochytrium replicatum]|nr:hypothetical protein BJ742DRAFT_762919 [Cladochytrium replicatum]
MNESVDQFDRALAVDQRRRSNPQAQWSATDSPALSSPYPDTSQPMQFHPIPVYPSQPEPIRHHTPRGPPLERNRSPIQQLPFSNQTTAPTTVVYPPKQHAQTPSHTEPLQPPVPPKHTQIAESPSDRPQPFPEKQRLTWWVIVSRIITCCIPTPLIVGLFKKPREPSAIQAFREKLALCFIILLVQAAVGYITFGFGSAICSRDQFSRFAISDILDNPNVGVVVVHSYLHDILGRGHPSITMPNGTITGMTINDYGGVNMSPVFPKFRAASACFKHYPKQFIDPPCTIPNIWNDTDGCVAGINQFVHMYGVRR